MGDVSNAAIVDRLDQVSGHVRQLFEVLEDFSATTASYFQKVDARLTSLETKVTGLDGRMRGMELRLDRLELRMDRLESRMDRLESGVAGGFADVGERLRRLEAA